MSKESTAALANAIDCLRGRGLNHAQMDAACSVSAALAILHDAELPPVLLNEWQERLNGIKVARTAADVPEFERMFPLGRGAPRR